MAKRTESFPHFSRIILDLTVDWDDEENESELDSNLFMGFYAYDLISNNIIKCINNKFIIDMNEFEDYVSERLTAMSGYCHNGFSYEIEKIDY